MKNEKYIFNEQKKKNVIRPNDYIFYQNNFQNV